MIQTDLRRRGLARVYARTGCGGATGAGGFGLRAATVGAIGGGGGAAGGAAISCNFCLTTRMFTGRLSSSSSSICIMSVVNLPGAVGARDCSGGKRNGVEEKDHNPRRVDTMSRPGCRYRSAALFAPDHIAPAMRSPVVAHLSRMARSLL